MSNNSIAALKQKHLSPVGGETGGEPGEGRESGLGGDAGREEGDGQRGH